MIERNFLYVACEWVEPEDGRTTDVIYPFTEEPIGRAALAGSSDMDRAVRAARAAFDTGPWSRTTPGERARIRVPRVNRLRGGGPERHPRVNAG